VKNSPVCHTLEGAKAIRQAQNSHSKVSRKGEHPTMLEFSHN
jgi:hypothetical protein